MDFCLGCIVVFSMSLMLKNEMVLVFLVFLNLIFELSKLLNFDLNFKNQELVFVTVFLTLCPYCSHSSSYLSGSVLAPTFIPVLLIFSVINKLNDFGFFLDFRHFFGLQLISFNIRQY